MKIIYANDKAGLDEFKRSAVARDALEGTSVEDTVREIIKDVRLDRDEALIHYTKTFDKVDVKGRLLVSDEEMDAAFKAVPKRDLNLLKTAARRIMDFHKRQVQRSWTFKEKDGTVLGQKVTPLNRVGIYVPGGKAIYPSTVLMNAIPAKAAGVDECVMVTPPGKDGLSPYVLSAARLAGVDRIFRVGGAQSVAALAYGTETVPTVDKITGPGNVYVATAKRLVYGAVDIDMFAGPSEILVINDGAGDPAWIAADLLSQAEHDELARCTLLTTSDKMAEAVKKEVEEQTETLGRGAIAKAAIDGYGRIVVIRDLEEAAMLSNQIAPEHLELFVDKPFRLLKLIRNAGAVFLGRYAPEALGDYIAGPNHTLPTGGAARFSSPLGVDAFMKKTSVLGFTRKGLSSLGKDAERFAALEGLDAHAKSVGIRFKKDRQS